MSDLSVDQDPDRLEAESSDPTSRPRLRSFLPPLPLLGAFLVLPLAGEAQGGGAHPHAQIDTAAHGELPAPGDPDEGETEAEAADDGDFMNVGGAVRFNLLSEFYESSREPNNTQFTWDTWRVNVQGRMGDVGIQFEYRWYPTFNTHFVKEGWFEYAFTEQTEVQVGVTQTPFGNIQYNSHNWWFQLPYYVGLEDDHDMGLKVAHLREDGWNLHVAYFLQPEPSGPARGAGSFGIGGSGRYSYDIIPTEGQSNQEKHQGNVRLTRTLDHEGGSTEIGGSVQLGGLYNSALDEWGTRWAWAVHADRTYGPWNVLAQFLQYDHDAIDDTGASTYFVRMGAYGAPYDVAAEAWIATLGVQYSWDVEWGPVTGVSFYDNYSYMGKAADGFAATQQNVLGFSVASGGLFTYFDLAMGRNHPWLTEHFGAGLAAGASQQVPQLNQDEWNSRFNVNVGYYF